MMLPMYRLLALALVAACGGSDPSAAPVDLAQPAADPAPCPDVASHELQIMNIGFLGDQKTGDLKAKIRARCHDDGWTLDARRCILTATGFDDMSACQDKLTPAQRAAYQRDMQGSNEPQVPDSPAAAAQPELLK